MPKYINGFIRNNNLRKVFETPSPDIYETHCRHIPEETMQQLKNNLNELYNEDDSLPFADLNKQLLVENIAVLLYRSFRYEEFIEKKSPYYDKMITVKNFLDDHYAEKISLSDLADKFYLHPTNISKFFSKCFGFSINNYITMRRLSEAQRLLENTDLSINFIAEAVGYCDSTAFVSKYSAITGKTPLQYRKAYRKNF